MITGNNLFTLIIFTVKTFLAVYSISFSLRTLFKPYQCFHLAIAGTLYSVVIGDLLILTLLQGRKSSEIKRCPRNSKQIDLLRVKLEMLQCAT